VTGNRLRVCSSATCDVCQHKTRFPPPTHTVSVHAATNVKTGSPLSPATGRIANPINTASNECRWNSSQVTS